MLLLPLLGCPAPKDDTGEPAPLSCEDPVLLEDVHNYQFSGTLDISEVEVRAWSEAAPTDYLIDWSGATADLQGHPMNPAVDVEMVTLVAFPSLSPAEIEDHLSTNTLQQSDIGGYAFATVSGVTSIQLSELSLLGNDIDIESYLTEGSATWMLILASGSVPGVGTLLTQLVIPLDASLNTDIPITSESVVLDYSVDLTAQLPAGFPEGGTTLDWSALTVDGRGDVLDQADIDTAKIAYFATGTYEGLATDFLDVELNADILWSAPVESGSSIDVGQLTGSEPFTGVAEGVYALALQCSTCSNPAPLFFGQLTPCE